MIGCIWYNFILIWNYLRSKSLVEVDFWFGKPFTTILVFILSTCTFVLWSTVWQPMVFLPEGSFTISSGIFEMSFNSIGNSFFPFFSFLHSKKFHPQCKIRHLGIRVYFRQIYQYSKQTLNLLFWFLEVWLHELFLLFSILNCGPKNFFWFLLNRGFLYADFNNLRHTLLQQKSCNVLDFVFCRPYFKWCFVFLFCSSCHFHQSSIFLFGNAGDIRNSYPYI